MEVKLIKRVNTRSLDTRKEVLYVDLLSSLTTTSEVNKFTRLRYNRTVDLIRIHRLEVRWDIKKECSKSLLEG